MAPTSPDREGRKPLESEKSNSPIVLDAVRIADVLAKLAIEVLDAERERTGVDEWDEADTRCYLYNAAHAWVDGDPSQVLEYE